ncbi:MAG: phage/plasmid replication protein, II/X family, partial [Acinetobacter baumannii]|nr:phage/plasmid replication protein, II/X family [Acinetobacter baumannii]
YIFDIGFKCVVVEFFKFLTVIKIFTLEKLAEMLPKPTFYRHLSELCECGFSKAFLQNLHDNKAKNVIPFMKLVEIDFSQQLPEWYEPPVSQFKSVA